MKILLIDDSNLARKALIKAIQKAEPSAEFFEAETGMIGIELFKKERPRVVFLDLTMPIMTGYEVLVEIMKIDPNAQVVVVSADIQDKAREKVLNDGAKNIYPKPINDEKILHIFMHDIIV
jgi:two-component system chemotaxis response regulator CheY